MSFKELQDKIQKKQKELNDLLNDLNEQLSLELGNYSELSIPQGATHYRILNCKVEYIMKSSYGDHWSIWWDCRKDWMTTLWKRVEVGKDVKLLAK